MMSFIHYCNVWKRQPRACRRPGAALLALAAVLVLLLGLAGPGPVSALTVTGLAAGHITCIAGNGIASDYDAGAGGPATSAQLSGPKGIAVDSLGDVFFLDPERYVVCEIAAVTGTQFNQSMTAGYLYWVAGTPHKSGGAYYGDGGPATSANFGAADDVAVDSAGNLYLDDTNNCCIHKVDRNTGIITTVAGVANTQGYSGDGGAATSALLNYPESMAIDSAGDIFIADANNNRLREVPATSGTYYGIPMTAGDIYTIAGNGNPGVSGDGGSALSADLDVRFGLAVDSSGNIYIAGFTDNDVRKVSAGDIISTVAGTGASGYSGDGGAATSAQVGAVQDVAVGGAGNLYLSDITYNCVREVNTGGIISTVAGGGSGNNGNGGLAVGASLSVSDLAADSAGNLYLSDYYQIRYVQLATPSYTALANLTLSGSPGLNYNGSPFTYDLNNLTLAGTDQNGNTYSLSGLATTWSVLSGPAALNSDGHTVTITSYGTLQVQAAVSNSNGNIINVSNTLSLKVLAPPVLYTLALSGSPTLDYNGSSSTYDLNNLTLAGTDENGNSYGLSGLTPTWTVVSGPATLNSDGHTVTITGSGALLVDATISGVTSNILSLSVGAATRALDVAGLQTGYITTVAGTSAGGYGGDGGPATSALMHSLSGAAVDSAGDLFIADVINECVREVPATTGTYFGIRMTAGDIYTVAGTGTNGYNGDGIAATSAELYWPTGVAVDLSGNLYIADDYNFRLREVPSANGTQFGQSMTAGDIYTVASGRQFIHVAVDSNDNLYFSSIGAVCEVAAESHNQFGQSMTAGDTYAVAGNGVTGYNGNGIAATSAEMAPASITVDRYGNLYISDGANYRVREVPSANGTQFGQSMTAGDIYTIAGNGSNSYSGDGLPATLVGAAPTGISLDAAGNLYISDSGDYRVREVPAASGTQFGQSMTAGDIYTIAGNGVNSYTGDGGPAAAAELYGAYCGDYLVMDNNGNLYVTTNSCVRFIQMNPPSSPALVSLGPGSNPGLVYNGSSFTYNLNNLTLAGTDQNGNAYSLSNDTVSWAVYAGPATLNSDGHTLSITGSGAVGVTATVSNSNGNVILVGDLTLNAVTVPVTSVNLSKTSDTINMGGSDTLTASVSPTNASDPALTWTSSDPSVATVVYSGASYTINAVGVGTASITATTTDGSDLTATCAVTVQPAATTITGSAALGSFSGSLTGQIQVYVDETQQATTDANGNYTIYGVSPGSHLIEIKSPGYLEAEGTIIVASSTSVPAVTLLAGDVNGDGVINIDDYTDLVQAYGATSGSSNWNAAADFNRDGVINIDDYTDLVVDYGKSASQIP